MIRKKRKVLCLDWDSRSLRLVAARVGGGAMRLEDAHAHTIPADVNAQDPAQMGAFIRRMLDRHQIRPRPVVVDVPRERTVINRMTLPPTPMQEVAAAVRFQAMRELPFSLDSAEVDYVITRQDEKGLTTEVLLAAVMHETLHALRDTCLAAGLTPERIGLRPYANLVSARFVTDLKDRSVLFVDVGPGATEIDVLRDDSVAFARSVAVSVPVPRRDAATPTDSRIISLAEINTVENTDEAIAAAVDELIVEVTRTLNAYRASATDVTVDGVMIAGATGIETDLADALYEQLGVPCDLFDPTGPLEIEAAEAGKLRSFSAALGLAWGMSQADLLAIDFLNPKRPISARQTMQTRVRRISIAAAAVLAVAAGGLGAWYYRLAAEAGKLVAANAELQKDLDGRTAIANHVARADDWHIDAIWPDELLEVSKATIDPGKKTLVRSVELRADSNEQKIKLRNVQVADWQVPIDYVQALNELTLNENERFRAAQLAFVNQPGGTEFKGKVDIDIELSDVARRMAEAAKRETDRKRARR